MKKFSPLRAAIVVALLAGERQEIIALRYGVSERTVQRIAAEQRNNQAPKPAGKTRLRRFIDGTDVES